jgi:hypothetical protein
MMVAAALLDRQEVKGVEAKDSFMTAWREIGSPLGKRLPPALKVAGDEANWPVPLPPSELFDCGLRIAGGVH